MPTTLVDLSRTLSRAVARLAFHPPVAYALNPLDYAWAPHRAYLERYGNGRKELLLVGMNPGPFGMMQTGVPFGEIAAVRDWMGIAGKVATPERWHPKRPIEGFDCRRSEVSGRRLWGWARERTGSPEAFFAVAFVHNYCPLAFLEEGGRNRTPDKLPQPERDALFALCDDALRGVVDVLRPRWVLGVGVFAERRARQALADRDVRIGVLPHPSPASPRANQGWEALADAALADLGLALPSAGRAARRRTRSPR